MIPTIITKNDWKSSIHRNGISRRCVCMGWRCFLLNAKRFNRDRKTASRHKISIYHDLISSRACILRSGLSAFCQLQVLLGVQSYSHIQNANAPLMTYQTHALSSLLHSPNTRLTLVEFSNAYLVQGDTCTQHRSGTKMVIAYISSRIPRLNSARGRR